METVDRRAGLFPAIVAGLYLTIAVVAFVVVVATLPGWPLPLPGAGVSVALMFPLVLPGVLVAIVQQYRERHHGLDEHPKAGGLWARLQVLSVALTVAGIMAGVLTGITGGPGSPSGPHGDCAYTLREAGNVFHCVSAAEHRRAEAGEQRMTAAVLQALTAGPATAFIGMVRRRRAGY